MSNVSKIRMENLTNDFVEYVENTVQNIVETKEKAMIDPPHAIDLEVMNKLEKDGYDLQDVKAALNYLAINKRIYFGRTISNKWFTVNKNVNTKKE